jgi:hypothetical protein
LIVDVPYGETSVITFGNAAQGSPPPSAIVFYNGSGAVTQMLRAEKASYGLISITFVSNSSDPQPQSASIVAGLVDGYPTTPANQSTCLVNVTFITAPPPTPPSPPPPLSTVCTSQYPSNPCYCQGSYCFNFAGGSTNTNCFTPQGLTCIPSTLSNPVAAGFYNTAPGPVCNCTNPGTSG